MKTLYTILILTCCSVAHASEISQRVAVEKMLKATKVEKNLAALYKQMETNIGQQFKQMDVQVEMRPILTKYMNKQIDVMKEELSWQKLKDNIATAYMKVYTEEEVVEITKFYTSPIGVKYVDKMPELTQEMMNAIQSRLPVLVEKYQLIAAEMDEEIKLRSAVK